MSTIAVFLAMGLGGAWAATNLKKNSVSSKQVKNGSLASKDLKDEKGVTGADVADGSIGSVDVADGTVGSVDLGDSSVGSAKIAGGSVGSAALTPDEAAHVVGASGEPAFGTGGDRDCTWSNFPGGVGGNPVSFYKDQRGYVHLNGLPGAENGTGGDQTCDASSPAELVEDFRVFTLPAGYRPANLERIVTADVSGGPVAIIIGAAQDTTVPAGLGSSVVFPAGVVVVSSVSSSAALDGFEFRTAGTGSGLGPVDLARPGPGSAPFFGDFGR